VTLLSCGRLMYHGPRDGLVDWFGGLGYEYDAALHGVVSDWALDLVACGSHKPARFYGPKTITTREEVRAASARFVAQWVVARGLPPVDEEEAGAKAGRLASVFRGSSSAAAAATAAAAAARRERDAADAAHAPFSASILQRARSSGGGAARRAAAAAAAAALGGLRGGPLSSGGGAAGAEEHLVASSWWQQFRWILKREITMITRNPADVAGRTLTFAWVAAFAGIFYYGLPAAGAGPRLRFNMLLNIIAFYCLIPYVSMSLYTADKKVYLADMSAKLFGTSSYYAAKVRAAPGRRDAAQQAGGRRRNWAVPLCDTAARAVFELFAGSLLCVTFWLGERGWAAPD
jgi:ATP-binding cassette subfamily G (WHITE) protein 2